MPVCSNHEAKKAIILGVGVLQSEALRGNLRVLL